MFSQSVRSVSKSVVNNSRRSFVSNSKKFNSKNQQQQKKNMFGKGVAAAVSLAALFGGSMLAEDDQKTKQIILQKQKDNFNKFATASIEGERYMTADDFLNALTTPETEGRGDQLLKATLDADKFKILFQMADVDHTGYISFNEYAMFDELMSKPEAEYFLAFKLFDRDGNGTVSKNDFQNVVSASLDPTIPFDFNCELVKLYFGDGASELNYSQFTQLLKDFQQERVKQEFRHHDSKKTGYIPKEQFAKILSSVKLRRIPENIRSKLESVSELNAASGHPEEVSYSQFVACNDLLLHIPSYGRVLKAAALRNSKSDINKEEFLQEARKTTSIEITPMEVELIYHLLDYNKDGKLNVEEFEKATGLSTTPATIVPILRAADASAKSTMGKGFVKQVWESIENFALGSVAGAIGATAVYPIDLVKTRMQNQRAVDPSQRIYNNSWDCFRKVLKNEGFVGLYRGLGPQLVGVAPEKAIKLTVNDLLRNLFGDKSKGEIYLPLEILAGAGAGASQVMFTNPLEIVKIRLQVQGKGGATAMQIVRELGFSGLYKGAGACLLRDIPFSAIYFPAYAKMKTLLADKDGNIAPKDLFISGMVAGIPAASLVTPADVIKTRLQVKAKSGEQTYDGIRDCAQKIWREEGFRAFFKGCVARVFRSSPQFGVTLLSYEMLQKHLLPHAPPKPPTSAPISERDWNTLRRASTPVEKVQEMENKFGTFHQNKQ
ncbi:EF-hand domain-containing protein [Heterostelium album PN500]|uniref:EF-hand domain-containing protein n=1 Tax=Heterostelium pallidum (strain ATCC 26659 / Pp 5 / PN500) TaxID=670386 RepID=D3AXG3_HETP5|nr:EF-hand domain-containing protein [Heterostelium album PN500]EFA86232.1 EF-hand domain-containing protein [Heterostelium album PN500]|eukprot:XP_020438337.1 EF-hand domain-containing protein [Heterostelium album PN500]